MNWLKRWLLKTELEELELEKELLKSGQENLERDSSDYNYARKKDKELKDALKKINNLHSYIRQSSELSERILNSMLSYPIEVQLFVASTEDCYKGGRRVGNTTRLVDLAIQFLFDWGEIRRDWFIFEGEHTDARQHAFDIIRKRLYSEHYWEQLQKHVNKPIIRNQKEVITIDKSKFVYFYRDDK